MTANMPTEAVTAIDEGLAAFFQAVGEDLEMLAALHDREPDAALIGVLKRWGFPGNLGLTLTSQGGRQALRQMQDGVTRLPEDCSTTVLDPLCAEYADIYLNHTLRASPLESVWTDEENIAYQQSMFQVRDYYKRYGVAAENWRRRADDHLVLQLVFIAHVMGQPLERDVLADLARFMDEHLLRWVPEFSRRVATRCEIPYFAGLALLTDAYLEELRQILEQLLGEARPTREEIDQRMSARAATAPAAPLKFVPGAAPSW